MSNIDLTGYIYDPYAPEAQTNVVDMPLVSPSALAPQPAAQGPAAGVASGSGSAQPAPAPPVPAAQQGAPSAAINGLAISPHRLEQAPVKRPDPRPKYDKHGIRIFSKDSTYEPSTSGVLKKAIPSPEQRTRYKSYNRDLAKEEARDRQLQAKAEAKDNEYQAALKDGKTGFTVPPKSVSDRLSQPRQINPHRAQIVKNQFLRGPLRQLGITADNAVLARSLGSSTPADTGLAEGAYGALGAQKAGALGVAAFNYVTGNWKQARYRDELKLKLLADIKKFKEASPLPDYEILVTNENGRYEHDTRKLEKLAKSKAELEREVEKLEKILSADDAISKLKIMQVEDESNASQGKDSSRLFLRRAADGSYSYDMKKLEKLAKSIDPKIRERAQEILSLDSLIDEVRSMWESDNDKYLQSRRQDSLFLRRGADGSYSYDRDKVVKLSKSGNQELAERAQKILNAEAANKKLKIMREDDIKKSKRDPQPKNWMFRTAEDGTYQYDMGKLAMLAQSSDPASEVAKHAREILSLDRESNELEALLRDDMYQDLQRRNQAPLILSTDKQDRYDMKMVAELAKSKKAELEAAKRAETILSFDRQKNDLRDMLQEDIHRLPQQPQLHDLLFPRDDKGKYHYDMYDMKKVKKLSQDPLSPEAARARKILALDDQNEELEEELEKDIKKYLGSRNPDTLILKRDRHGKYQYDMEKIKELAESNKPELAEAAKHARVIYLMNHIADVSNKVKNRAMYEGVRNTLGVMGAAALIAGTAGTAAAPAATAPLIAKAAGYGLYAGSSLNPAREWRFGKLQWRMLKKSKIQTRLTEKTDEFAQENKDGFKVPTGYTRVDDQTGKSEWIKTGEKAIPVDKIPKEAIGGAHGALRDQATRESNQNNPFLSLFNENKTLRDKKEEGDFVGEIAAKIILEDYVEVDNKDKLSSFRQIIKDFNATNGDKRVIADAMDKDNPNFIPGLQNAYDLVRDLGGGHKEGLEVIRHAIDLAVWKDLKEDEKTAALAGKDDHLAKKIAERLGRHYASRRG